MTATAMFVGKLLFGALLTLVLTFGVAMIVASAFFGVPAKKELNNLNEMCEDSVGDNQ